MNRFLKSEFLERMWNIRRFELELDRLFSQGLIKGTSHLCVGQEAVAVGACAGIEPTDYVTSNHRGHGHFIAKGGDPKRIMAEIFGKTTGYSAGRGGSQHMACFEIGFLGSNGITGGAIPIAAGAALSLQMDRKKAVVLCFFGDGATSEGAFHEGLNLASIWSLPVIFLCENNLYGMSTPVSAIMKVARVADRALAYGLPGVRVDGNDLVQVAEAVSQAATRAREGGGPTLVECETYRTLGHSKSDKRVYRTREEEEAWQARDPLLAYERRLMEEAILNETDIEEIRSRAEKMGQDCVAFAQESPLPVLEDWVREGGRT